MSGERELHVHRKYRYTALSCDTIAAIQVDGSRVGDSAVLAIFGALDGSRVLARLFQVVLLRFLASAFPK